LINKNNHIDSTLKNAFQELVTPEVGMLDWDVIEKKLDKKDRLSERVRLSFSIFLMLILSVSYLQLQDSSNLNSFDFTTENTTYISNDNTSIDKNILTDNQKDKAKEVYKNQRYNPNNNIIQEYDNQKRIYEAPLFKGNDYLSIEWQRPLPLIQDFNFLDLEIPAEKDNVEIENSLGIEVIGSASPNTIGRVISENVNLAGLIHKDYKSNVLNSENLGVSMNYGLATNFSIKNWMFGAGLNMIQWRENINYNYSIDYDIDVNLTENRIDNYVLRPEWRREQISLNRTNEYNFVEIPVYVGYKSYISPRLEWRNKMGLILTQMTSKNGELADYTSLYVKDVNNLDRWRNSSISTQVSSGIYYHKNRYFVGLEPFFSVGVSSITNNDVSALNVRPFNYGLHLNVGFTIKKDNKK